MVPRGAAVKQPLRRGPTLKSLLCSVVISFQILKDLYGFLEISLKTINMVLLQPAEIADRYVSFLKRVQDSIEPYEVLHAGGMLSVPGVLR